MNELDDNCLDVYESSRLYKERTRKWHNKLTMRREFHIGDSVLLFNSRLKLFPGKLRSRWSRFQVTKVFPYGSVEVTSEAADSFEVNGSRLKHYVTSEPMQGKQLFFLSLLPNID